MRCVERRRRGRRTRARHARSRSAAAPSRSPRRSTRPGEARSDAFVPRIVACGLPSARRRWPRGTPILHVRSRVELTPLPLRVRLVLREQQLVGALDVQPRTSRGAPRAPPRPADVAHARRAPNSSGRASVPGAPAPRVAKPALRQRRDRRLARKRAAVRDRRCADQDVVRRPSRTRRRRRSIARRRRRRCRGSPARDRPCSPRASAPPAPREAPLADTCRAHARNCRSASSRYQ